jgi:cytochrome c peroxidase
MHDLKLSKMFTLLSMIAFLVTGMAYAQELTPKETLGQNLYFDTNLSTPTGQSCASCHDPDFGFVDPDSNLPVSQGVLPKNRFGNRNSPSSAYAMYAPNRYFDTDEGLWLGGQFWDGRATGQTLGDPLADQALGPFLNPLEMNNPSKLVVINKIRRSAYADLFEQVWGAGILNDVEAAYDKVALSIAAFERTALFAPFSSKYDAYLKECLDLGGYMTDCANGIGSYAEAAGDIIFNTQEWEGLQLFMGENNNDGILQPGEGANCSACHVSDWTMAGPGQIVPDWAPGYVPPVFTDFSFDNLGTPANPDNPFYFLPKAFNPDGENFLDLGLGGNLMAIGYPANVYEPEIGKFKVMTLRNIGITAPYLHDGLFTTLEDVVHFYNTRDVEGWPAPEVPLNVNVSELGNLGLSASDEAAVAAFMRTLSDGYMIP